VSEDKDAEKGRAERLREEIERLKRGGDEGCADAPQSPREFVEKRMRELDEEPVEADDADS
jgi:hypothetical protein